MIQVVDRGLLTYVDDHVLIYHYRDVRVIQQKLIRNIWNACDRFVNNKLIIHFWEDKAKGILFGAKKRLQKTGILALDMGKYI